MLGNKKIKVNHPPSESDVGISQYLSDSALSFHGIIKHRYSDFIVNEVNLEDQIICLKSTSVPPHYAALLSVQEPEKVNDDEQGMKELFQIMTDATLQEQLKEFIQNKTLDQPLMSMEIVDKTTRTHVHQIVKKYFSDFMDTETVSNCIRFRLKSKQGSFRQKSQNPSWSALGGDYLHCTLVKENKDTMEAIDLLCKRLHCSSKLVTYAGTKDKRAVTSQRISLHRFSALKIAALDFSKDGMHIGDFEYKLSRLQLGDLKGNRFCLTLRDVQPQDPDVIHNTLNSLKENGFINYFGMQRFGTQSIGTHILGMSLLRGNWKEAVELFLDYKPQDSLPVKKARDIWFETQDPKKALDLFPRRCIAERAILSCLSKQTQGEPDYLQAILAIPRNLKTLYVHAYQSFIWNQMASERIKYYGNHVVLGDLVTTKDPSIVQVKVLTDPEELSKYSMQDIVLPQPGYDVLYPENEMKNKYMECMARDGFHPLEMRRKQKDFSLPGSYRALISKPKNMSWRLLRYSDDTLPLSCTDLDLLNSKPLPESIPGTFSSSFWMSIDFVDGPFLGVVLEWTLSSSTYATMALREFMKSETSSFHQSALSLEGHLEIPSQEPSEIQ